MAKCECCGKGVTFGIKVSHSHRRSNRTWKPNAVFCLDNTCTRNNLRRSYHVSL